MEADLKQLETVQSSLQAYVDSRAPDMNFVVVKLLGGLWTTLNQWLIPMLVGEGEIGVSNINVIATRMQHCIILVKSITISMRIDFIL